MKILIAQCLASIGVGAWIFTRLLGDAFEDAIATKTDPKLYPEIIAVRQDGDPRYTHFPPTIPKVATGVGFYHVPGFLQGGDSIALRLRLDRASTAAMLKDLTASKREEAPHGNLERGFLHVYPSLDIAEAAEDELRKHIKMLPADFRVFLHETDLADIKRRWNHNFLAYTAVSLARREVVYYADNW